MKFHSLWRIMLALTLATTVVVSHAENASAQRRSSAKRFTLVKDGRPTSVIVTNGRPTDGQVTAAAELQEHIRIMSGATLPIVKENELRPGQAGGLILVGQSNLTKGYGIVTKTLEPETFVIKCDPNVLILAGEDGSDVDGPPRNSTLPESLSDRYARWYNELAVRARKLDPDARVVAYAYSKYRSPPTNIKHIEPNVWIGYVGFNAYPRPESYRKMSHDEWFGWSKLGATVFLRSNSLYYLGEGAPFVASHQMAEDLQFQVKNGLRATDYDALQGYWATTGPTYYVLARMLWDTDADVEQVLDEFHDSFGPMKEIAKDYYDYWEAFTVGLGNNEKFMNTKRPDRLRAYRSIYSEAVFRKADAILARAEPLLRSASKEERDRFHNIELGLQHGRLLAAALADGKTSTGTAGKRLMAFRREIAHRNVINVYWTISKEMRYRVFK